MAPVVAAPSSTTAPVHVNVGGTSYTTSLETLTRFPNSKLAKYFDGSLPITLDPIKNQYFFDRDGKTFRHVLNFLRNSKLILPDNFRELKLLLEEAVYFEIEDLCRDIQQFMENNIKKSEEIEVKTVNKEYDSNSSSTETSDVDENSSQSTEKNKKKKRKNKRRSKLMDKQDQKTTSEADQGNDVSVCTATVEFLADKVQYECPITKIKNRDRPTVEQGDIREVKWINGKYYKAKILNTDCMKQNDYRYNINNCETNHCTKEKSNGGHNLQSGDNVCLKDKQIPVGGIHSIYTNLNRRYNDFASVLFNNDGRVFSIWCTEENLDIETVTYSKKRTTLNFGTEYFLKGGVGIPRVSKVLFNNNYKLVTSLTKENAFLYLFYVK